MLVAANALCWGAALILAVALLWSNPAGDWIRLNREAGLVITLTNLQPALAVLGHPLTLAGLGLFALAWAAADARLATSPEFPLGLLVGTLSVLLTAALAGLVLVLEGERWQTYAVVVFLAHLPLAVLEGLVLGVTVSFLARVKPELVGQPARLSSPGQAGRLSYGERGRGEKEVAALALAALLVGATPAFAHALEGDYTVDAVARNVRVRAWYETGDAPEKGTATVLRADGSTLAEGPLDAEGNFTFRYAQAEDLRVRLAAPGGHRAELRISAAELAGAAPAHPDPRARWRDLAVGVSFVLALGSFVLSLRTHRRVREIAQALHRPH
jgi:hypothetical protein